MSAKQNRTITTETAVDSNENREPRPQKFSASSVTGASFFKLVRWSLRATLICGALGLLLILIACCLAPWNYQCDLLSNFRFQYLGLGLGLGLVALLGRNWPWLLILSLLTLPHANQVLPYYWTRDAGWSPLESDEALKPELSGSTGQVREKTLRVVSLNVLYLNQDYDRAIDFLLHADADVIVLCECVDDWYPAIRQGLAETHPYTSSDIFPMWDGTRVFSRHPLKAATDLPQFRRISAAEKLLAVSMRWQEHDVIVMGIHAASPINVGRFRFRNEFLRLATTVGPQVVDPLIMAGDFNCTSGSPFFVNDERLRDTRYGFGWQGSWPSKAPAVLRIPIDHVLINQHWDVLHRELGPNIGSDHLPVITELRLVSTATSTKASR
jgi:endonuclease/exonuclease/phosphatase (EEP) superfamily protein YafD